MKITTTKLAGVLIIEPRIFHDSRGYFFESFQALRYQEQGIPAFVQDNFSRSNQNVIRGLHYQLEHPQGKLIFVARGKILDVMVDIRKNSPTFGHSMTVELDDQLHRQVYIPIGFAHGFCVISPQADVIYKCTDYYHPPAERGILWSDPDLQIPWPINNPIVAPKDELFPLLKNIPDKELF